MYFLEEVCLSHPAGRGDGEGRGDGVPATTETAK